MTSVRPQANLNTLSVVQTQPILFSSSERVGSDIERILNWMMNFQIDSKSIKVNVIQIQSRSLSDSPRSDIDFKNKMAWVWTTLKYVGIIVELVSSLFNLVNV